MSFKCILLFNVTIILLTQPNKPPNNPFFRPFVGEVRDSDLFKPLIGEEPNDSNCFEILFLESLFLIKYAAPKPRAVKAIFLFIISTSSIYAYKILSRF